MLGLFQAVRPAWLGRFFKLVAVAAFIALLRWMAYPAMILHFIIKALLGP